MRRALALLILLGGQAAAQTTPAPSLADLAGALKVAPNETVAATLEAQIRQVWARAGTPAVRLLLSRGARELESNAPADALDSFNAALDLSPDLLDGWRGRATAQRLLGDYAGAVRDIQEVLRRDPSSFIAFQDLSRLAEARADWRGALIAWQKLLELDPQTPGGQVRLRDLKRRALGEQL